MRVVYFDVTEAVGTQREPLVRPPLAADLSRVFHQLDLLLDYAPLVTAPPGLNVMGGMASGGAAPGGPPETVKQTLAKINQKVIEYQKGFPKLTEQDLEADLIEPAGGADIPEAIKRAAFELGIELPHASDEPPNFTTRSLAELRSRISRLSPTRPLGSVVSLRMDSPLEIVLEIPLVAWPGIAIGLLALAERIATMPVRIARKRKEEMLQSAILDKQTQLVSDGRADVLAELLLQQGPDRQVRGPDDIAFLDPEDPRDELEAVAVQR